MAANDTMSYKEAYAILKANAEKLRREDEIDIDQLVPMVEQSSKADMSKRPPEPH
jgi:hypothetical protein